MGWKQYHVVSEAGKQILVVFVYFLTTESEERFILKTIVANYGWKWSFLLFEFGGYPNKNSSNRKIESARHNTKGPPRRREVAIVDVLTASNNDVKLVQTRPVHFASLKLSSRFERINSTAYTSTAISSIRQIYRLFAPWNTMWHCFYPIDFKARAKMTSILNKIKYIFQLVPA